MKKRTVIICLILSLLLCGCGQSLPETAADGTPWGEDWTNLGVVAGVEPLEGWTPQRSEDALAAEGIYFAAWTWGEGVKNADGSTVYPAQIFLVLQEGETAEDTDACVAGWESLINERYLVDETVTAGDFTMLSYRSADESASFAGGVCALGIHGNYAVNAELTCQADSPLDPQEVLTAFLNNIHYAS